MNKKEIRRDFKGWAVDLVYRLQDGICAKEKCSKTLANGFHRHHEDGDSTNNSIENLKLFCAECHGGEAYATYIKKKKKGLSDVEAAINMALEGKLSGAAMDKLLDAIKLGLGLTREIYGKGMEQVPASIKMEQYLLSSGILLKEYEKGVKKGIELGASISNIEVAKVLVNNLELSKKVSQLLQVIASQVKKEK